MVYRRIYISGEDFDLEMLAISLYVNSVL